MKIHSSLFLLGAAGVLSALATAAAASAPDTSAWACASCPYPKGTTGTFDAGVGSVSEDSQKFGDFTGLQRKGAHLVLGGSVQHRDASGYHADAVAANLGLDIRSASARVGREGLYDLSLGFDQLPRHFADGARSPFIGAGGAELTLPGGYPAPTTAAMPLATTLNPVDIGFSYRRFDLGGRWLAQDKLAFRLGVRVDERDGTRPLSVSFFSTAAQLAAPVKHQTQQFEAAMSYTEARWQAVLALQLSRFQNRNDALVWANPFSPVVGGDTRGQLALAPDNQHVQLSGTVAHQFAPGIQASANLAVGQMTQDAPFLPPTINAALAATVPALPASSLDGRVDTFTGGVRLTARVLPTLSLLASLDRDVRDNRTAKLRMPGVATDMFLTPQARTSTPFSQWQDRLRLSADLRGPAGVRLSVGADQDNRERNFSEVVDTRETTGWARLRAQPAEWLGISMKLSGAERRHSGYGVSTWFGSPENPLLRKYTLADRRRDAVSLRADLSLGESLAVGIVADGARDDYVRSLVGLQEGRTDSLGADLAWTVAEGTRLTAFAQLERTRSLQAGSQAGVGPDWTARSRDRFELLGLGVQHEALGGKLELGADLSQSRSRSELAVQTGVLEPDFPRAGTTLKRARLSANYKIKDGLTLLATLWHEEYSAVDWRLDGVLPATVGNLLTLGQTAPHYRVLVLTAALRHRF